MLLFLDLGSKPLTFIKFNPDAYYDANDNLIESCWKYCPKKQFLTVGDKIKWQNRLEALKRCIELTASSPPTMEIDVQNACFDGWHVGSCPPHDGH
jgi:hypothetical protein